MIIKYHDDNMIHKHIFPFSFSGSSLNRLPGMWGADERAQRTAEAWNGNPMGHEQVSDPEI
jgi:hypothetical protein